MRRATADRASLVESGREGYGIAGRGFILSMDDEDEDRYVTLDELRESLRNEPEMLGLLDAAKATYDTYDPETEALVLVSQEEAIHVLLADRAGLRVLGQIDFFTAM